MKTLKERYENVMSDYINEFCKRHYMCFEEIDQTLNWMVHEVVFIDDLYIDFNDIRYDVDNDVPENVFEDWYELSSMCYELGITFPNYPNYVKGAPHISYDEIEKLSEAKKNIEKLEQEFKTKIDSINNPNS